SHCQYSVCRPCRWRHCAASDDFSSDTADSVRHYCRHVCQTPGCRNSRLGPQATRIVQETRTGTLESQAHRPDGTVTLLADNDFGGAFVGRIRVIDLVAINEENQVGILLDGA